MIVFVIVTAVLNIGLGYALAIYLGRARGFKGHRSSVAYEIPADASLMAPVPQVAPTPAISSPTPAPPPAVAPAAPPAKEPLAAEADGTELEQDVLAGIEEFRNQLAKMKAEPVEEHAVVAPAR